MGMTDAERLFGQFSEAGDIGPVDDYVFGKLPAGECESIELSRLPIDNKAGKSVTGCTVWYPAGQLEAVRKIRFTILADSPDCTFYLLRIAPGMSFKLNGPGHSVLNLTEHRFSMSIRMGGDAGKSPGCKAIIGERSFCAGAEAFLLNTTMLIKKNALWSNYVLVQGSNQHGVVDFATMKLVEYPRNRITLEPHAWVGRRAILCAGAHVGAGAIVGTGALVAGKVPGACIVGGNPARVIKRGRTWAHSLHHITKLEHAIIRKYVRLPAEIPIARRIWAKAVVGGVAGAAIFEGVLSML